MATLTLDLPHSMGSMRTSHLSEKAITLPSVDFGFGDLRDRMHKFTVRFDAFIEKERKRVLDERNQFRMNVTELQGKPWSTALWKRPLIAYRGPKAPQTRHRNRNPQSPNTCADNQQGDCRDG
jgi:hypothetical protein